MFFILTRRILVSTLEPFSKQEENPSVKGNVFFQALSHLTGMGYEQKESEEAIMRIRDSSDATRADAASIVARAVESLVQGT